MNAPVPASLLSAVEMAPKDPILGVTEAFNADPNPRKVNLGVGVYCDEDGKVPLLECVREAREALEAKAAPHPLPADRRHPGVRPGRPGTGIRRRQRGRSRRASDHGAGDRRHRRAQDRRRFPAPVPSGGAGLDQRSVLGESSRAVRRRRVRRQHLSLLRRRDARRRLRGDEPVARGCAQRIGRSCCTRAATIPPASTSTTSSGHA